MAIIAKAVGILFTVLLLLLATTRKAYAPAKNTLNAGEEAEKTVIK